MRIAYLINQYPHPSHAFIRREIRAHEAAGIPVTRFTLRPTTTALPDPDDQLELTQTRALLAHSAVHIALVTLLTLLTRPFRFARALSAARQLAKASPRKFAPFAYLAEACLLRRLLAKQNITHLHAHFGTNPAAIALLCKLLGGPAYTFTVHGPDEFDSAPTLSLALKARHAAAVISISHFAKSQLLRWLDPADHARIHIIHCGLDAAFLETPATAIPAAPYFLFVGRLTITKGLLTLLDALDIVKTRTPQVRLTLAGEGSDRLLIEQRIRTSRLEENVQLAGVQSAAQIRQHLQSSRALILPSYAEGLPVVLMEALAQNRPVISTPIAAIPELVRHQQTGWLVTPADAASLAQAMHEAIEMPARQLEQMAASARNLVHEHYNAAKESQKLFAIFRACHQAPGTLITRSQQASDSTPAQRPGLNVVPN